MKTVLVNITKVVIQIHNIVGLTKFLRASQWIKDFSGLDGNQKLEKGGHILNINSMQTETPLLRIFKGGFKKEKFFKILIRIGENHK